MNELKKVSGPTCSFGIYESKVKTHGSEVKTTGQGGGKEQIHGGHVGRGEGRDR